MLEEQLQSALAFLQTNPIIAAIIGGVLVSLFFFKPKAMFKLVAFCLVMIVVFYFITLFAGTVSTGSKRLCTTMACPA